jgi:hypothetical protein
MIFFCSIFISTVSNKLRKEKYKQSEKDFQKSRFRNTHGAMIDQKYKAIHVHDELIFTQTAESF